jgi:hypothetical protein
VKTAGFLIGLLCVGVLAWLVVDAEAVARRAAFNIARLEISAADRANEIAWLKSRIDARRANLAVPASMKRAGLDVASAPERRIPPPVLGRPGS